MNAPLAIPLQAKDFKSDYKPVWCPGCGDYSVLAAITKALATLDLKPHNVLLVPRGDDQPPRVVVTDFGLARALGPESANPSLPVEEALANAPEREGSYFKVPPGGS